MVLSNLPAKVIANAFSADLHLAIQRTGPARAGPVAGRCDCAAEHNDSSRPSLPRSQASLSSASPLLVNPTPRVIMTKANTATAGMAQKATTDPVAAMA